MPRTQHLKLMAQEEEAPLRAAFPEDPAPASAPEGPGERDASHPSHPPQEDMIHRTQEDWAAYPDLVYDLDRRRPRHRRHAKGKGPEAPEEMPSLEDSYAALRGEGPQEAARVPLWRYADGGDDDAPDAPDGEAAISLAARREGCRGEGLWAAIILLCFALLSLLGWTVVRWRQSYAPFREKVEIVSQNTIAQGVLVDEVHVGGMTRTQALRALSRDAAQPETALHITVRVDGQTWVITPQELVFQRNTDAVLDTAFAVGRQGSVETIATRTTPFEYRYQHLYHTVGSPVSLHTEVTYDPAAVRALVEIIESRINRSAVDAQVATFDFASRAFTFTDDRAGARLDGDQLYRQILAALDRRDLQAVITAESEPITPNVTKAELMSAFALVSSYTTETTSNANRNNNIDLAARAVSGTVVMPGETFSFNQATGQRTAEKGYLPAAAIAGGATVDEIGGGVCQVSSTLFNAAAMADLTILARSPHTWPSNYVDKGRDATVNWPNLDFSFRNDKDTPVFIVAWYQQRKCTVEIYGAVMGGGQSIDLETRLTATIQPPSEPIYELNPALEPGTTQEKKKARTGYTVETYKVYKRNGREVSRDLLCVSVYQMIQQVIEYN